MKIFVILWSETLEVGLDAVWLNSSTDMVEDFLWLCVAFVGLIIVFACICVVVDGHLVPGAVTSFSLFL
jgi:hypothetical protein